VHLAGKSHATDIARAETGIRDRLAHRQSARVPPVARILLGPARPRTGKGDVVARRGCCDTPVLADQDGSRAAGARINAEKYDGASLPKDCILIAAAAARATENLRRMSEGGVHAGSSWPAKKSQAMRHSGFVGFFLFCCASLPLQAAGKKAKSPHPVLASISVRTAPLGRKIPAGFAGVSDAFASALWALD
jgi:hypothetical protein